jgi:putative ABC transport system permease protein
MINLFIISVIRNLKKDKFHSFLNITGLALGIAAFLFIITTIFHELSFDSFNSKSSRIYRCVAFLKMGDVNTKFAKSEIPLAQAAMNDLPEVEVATRLIPRKNIAVYQNDQKFVEDEIWYADANVFKVFDFNLIEGNKENILSEPYSIILTKKAAEKYFGNINPVGQSLKLGDNKEIFHVKGILKTIPTNSHIQFDLLASFSSLPVSKRVDYWGDFTSTYTYFLLKQETDMKQFGEKYKTFPFKYWGSTMEKTLGKTIKEWESAGNYLNYELQPLRKIHLNTTFSEELKNHGNSRSLFIFSITGIFILIIACFNFINLSTAKASLRAKEIGLKKIVGSSRRRIIFQILAETFIQSVFALVVALGILFLFIPVMNNFSGLEIQPSFLLNKFTLMTIIGVPLIITFLAGSYPAFYITRFTPDEVIKGQYNIGKIKSLTRGTLVAFQFAVFIILIFCSVVIRKQLLFLHHQNPGFNKENVLVIKNMSRLNNSRIAFKNTLLENPEIINATFASKLPSADDDISNIFCQKGKNDQIFMKRLYVDKDFEKTLNTEMVDGRFFSDLNVSEKGNAIINEEAARLLGWTDCKDKILYDYNDGGKDYNVIGIVKDFHLRSMREKPAPLVIRISDQEEYLAIRAGAGTIHTTLETAILNWDKFNSDAPFEYFFLDENFDAQYKKEEQLSKLINLFTLIAISIACLGLFGLVSYTATQRQKEIGIRKVNGAKVVEIITMLNKDFIRWITWAFVFSTPVAWYAMHKWLENYAYKTSLSWWIFALAGLLALGIASLTVSWQSWKAATRNPVEALRYE